MVYAVNKIVDSEKIDFNGKSSSHFKAIFVLHVSLCLPYVPSCAMVKISDALTKLWGGICQCATLLPPYA